MVPIDVRKLAAVDMWGGRGSLFRRRVILAEFLVGAIACLGFGTWALLTAGGAFPVVIGIWLLGLGVNYVLLSRHAVPLSRAGALERELEGVEIRPALRLYTRRQIWVFAPFSFLLAERD